MKRHGFLALIVLMTIGLRLIFSGQIPPVFDAFSEKLRILSIWASVGNVLLLYGIAYYHLKNRKIALASSWVMAVLPWTIQEGRIVSQPNFSVFTVLLCLFCFQRMRHLRLKIAILFVFGVTGYLIYPDMWLFKIRSLINPGTDYLTNVFFILSPVLWFFNNSTYWWGGVRDIGILFLSFLPFIAAGGVIILQKKYAGLIYILLFFLFISSASPFLPESRELYLVTPFVSVMIGTGMCRLLGPHSLRRKVFMMVFLGYFMYEMMRFLHFYTVHYPIQVKNSSSHIHGLF